MDESHGRNNEQKKYNIKEYVFYNSIYMKFKNRPKKLNVKERKEVGRGGGAY